MGSQMESMSALRDRIIAEALSFRGTPYHAGAMVKGAGVDCASFILCVLQNCGLVNEEELGVYSGDWWCHTTTEKYMLRVLRHGYKVLEGVSWSTLEASPGNIALIRGPESKVYNHGGIIVKWPTVIHAAGYGVEQADASLHWLWSGHEVAIFDVVARWSDRIAGVERASI
jgi:cell wall-associated NlpC family hydrolase